MMNAAIFLVPAVHEIAIAAELTIAARAAEKPDPNALTDHPALDAGTKCIDAADDLMAWDTRPIDRKQALHCAGIRMADSTRLDADPHLAGSRSVQCFFGQLQPTWADRLYCAIVRCCFHHYLPNGRAGCRCPDRGAAACVPAKHPTPRQCDGRRAVFDFAGRKRAFPPIKAEIERYPTVTHPIVRTHPVTGRKCLYVMRDDCTGIEAMEGREAETLIAALADHIVKPVFVYRHRWRVGDLLMWDNCTVQHRAIQDYDLPQRRLMHRATMGGTVPLYQPVGLGFG